MTKTNIGLAVHCEKALKEKWFYLWGGSGQISTQELINQKAIQYPKDVAPWKAYLQKSIGVTRVCDCYGLVKGYLWWVDDKSNPKYNSRQDTNTSGAYTKAKEKGEISTLPEVVGLVLYMQGHVGVYMGNGRFIELMGGGVGAFEGATTNGKITKGSKFTHWFKDINISYVNEKPKEEKREKYMITRLELVKNNKKITTANIFFEGKHYVELRDYEESYGNIVKYDTNTKKIEVVGV
jgi:hypothetical protein